MRKALTFPWIHSSVLDLIFILLPGLFVLGLFFIFPEWYSEGYQVSTFFWVVLILGVDVAHVYSTLYRTYFHQENFLRHQNFFIIIPLLVWILGVILYGVSGKLFWSVLAYLAVFHFIRQQYGFMRIYSREEKVSKNEKLLDSIVIHLLTFYPIIYWHAHLPRNFSWMIDGDFVPGLPAFVERAAFGVYLLVIILYVLKEIKNIYFRKTFNVPKNLLILGTGFSWYFGIVKFNGDLAFTLTNVIAHGIPYLALVWTHEKKEARRFLPWYGIFIFVILLLFFSYAEEALWAGLIWREHLEVFGFLDSLPHVKDSAALTLLVPLLSVPQVTHYVLDGFIWKRKTSKVFQ